MMSRLRQLPLLALLFLAGSPGLGGVALQAIHACTADLESTRAAAAADSSHHGSHHGDEPESDECRCIGACHTAFATPAPRAAVVAHLELPPPTGLPVPHLPVISAAGRGHHFLPPATAPPRS